MPIMYDSKKIIPAPPRITIQKETKRSEDTTPRDITYSITARGTLVAFMGSPNSSGVFWTGSGYPPDENIPPEGRLRAILAKQGAMNALFCGDYKMFEVQPYDGTAPFKAMVRVKSITFEEGLWYDRCDYTIQMEAEQVWFGNSQGCSGSGFNHVEETWSIELQDEKHNTYRLQHTATSTRKAQYDVSGNKTKEGWEAARDEVLGVMNGAPAMYSAPNNLVLGAGFQPYTYTKGQQVDVGNGRYTATESWTLYDPAKSGGFPCLEEYTVNVRKGEDGKTKVSIDGNLQGLAANAGDDKIGGAEAKWNTLQGQLFSICQQNGGVTLNAKPLNSAFGKNTKAGTITFSREFDNRKDIYPGAISTVVSVTESKPSDVFASIIVLGKSDGPVLQDIQTKTAKRKQVSVEIVMPAETADDPAPAKPNTDSIVNPHDPGGFKERDEETWSESSGRYSRNVSWTWV